MTRPPARSPLRQGLLALALSLSAACASSAAEPPLPAPPPFSTAPAAAAVGAPAPAFVLPDATGQLVDLAALRGKVVVLEWFNPDCPFIVHAHEDGPLKDMPARWEAQGVVWLPVNSNAEGTQGHGVGLNQRAKGRYDLPRDVLIDATGAVGRAYGAKVTPHIYVIDREGKLAYMGGLDNAPLGKAEGPSVMPWTDEAIAAVVRGEAPRSPSTKAYGCSVKYKG
jgi:peroxiredoxin